MTRAEFIQLYHTKHKEWLGFTESLLTSHRRAAQAEDILHEVWILAWAEVDKLKGECNINSYMLWKIRTYIQQTVWLTQAGWQESYQRQRDVEWTLPLTERTGLHIDDHTIEEDEPTPIQRALESAFADLKPDEHDIVCLYVCADMPFEEIAGVMGSNLAAVRQRYYRALPKLRLALASVGISPRSYGDSRSHETGHDVA